MNFDYNFVYDMYNEMLSKQPIFVLVSGLKVVAAIFVVIVWYGRYLNALKDPENYQMPLKPKDIITGLGTIVLIGFYDQILNLMDLFFGRIEVYYADFQVQPKDLGLTQTEVIGEEADKDWTDTLKDMGHYVIMMIRDPTYGVVQVVRGIAWVIDLLIYAVFLAERFFALGIARILGGIALACSYHPKLSKWFYNWVGVYTAIWLLIIPYFLINTFTNVIYEESANTLESYGAGLIPGTYSPMIIVVLFIIWLKFKLFTASKEIVYKIFN